MLRPMRPAPLVLAALAIIGLACTPACRRTREEPPPPPPPASVSPWGEADSQAVARVFAEAAVAQPWSSLFRDRNGRVARLAIGAVEDRSGQTVPVEGFAQALAAALATSGGDRLAPGGADGDFLVTGAISATRGLSDGVPAIFFAIDLGVIDQASGDKVWHFAIEWPIAVR